MPTTPSYSFSAALALALEVGVGVGLQPIGVSVAEQDGRGQLLAPRHTHARSLISGILSVCKRD
jgi:hypothetical protein